MRTGFDKIATKCRKISKCLKCWDFEEDYDGNSKDNEEYMTLEVKLGDWHSKYTDDELIKFAKEIIKSEPKVKCYKHEYDGGSDYDCYTFWLKENI